MRKSSVFAAAVLVLAAGTLGIWVGDSAPEEDGAEENYEIAGEFGIESLLVITQNVDGMRGEQGMLAIAELVMTEQDSSYFAKNADSSGLPVVDVKTGREFLLDRGLLRQVGE